MRMPSWSVQVQGCPHPQVLTYSGERFEQNFADFRQKYGISDMYSGGFYPYDTLEEYWAWWSRQIYINRYDITPGRPYRELRKLITGKDYFCTYHQCGSSVPACRVFDKNVFFTPKATMACGNAPGLATGKPTTMRTLSSQMVSWQKI